MVTEQQGMANWLNPFSESVPDQAPTFVDNKSIEAVNLLVLAEPLVAQRIATVGAAGLELRHDVDVDDQWGHSLSSAMAVLQPPLEGTVNARARRERRKRQALLLNAQQTWPDLASVRDTAYLVCIDGDVHERGLPAQLYGRNSTKALLSWSGFSYLLDKLITAVSPAQAPRWIESGAMLKEALTTIIFETFKNTHDHARTEVDGADVRNSVRGIYARFYSFEHVVANNEQWKSATATPAERYLALFVPKEQRPGVRVTERPHISGFLEISVIDTGPGMAARWLKKNASEDSKAELEAVLQCFQKGRTTMSTSGRGFGLWKVLMNLQQLRGFISVRTNAIHAYRQFGFGHELPQIEVSTGQFVPNEQLLDWKRGLSSVPSSYPALKGTVVSFLIPMGDA